jgi:cargo-transport protein YPP1
LSEAIKKEKSFVEDEFQAQVCLGWIYWVRAEPDLACSHLPSSIGQEFAQLDGTGRESAGWTKVCAVKASHIKGTSLVKTGAHAKALETFKATLPILSSISAKSVDGSREQRTWTELLLTQFCMLSSHTIKSKLSSLLESETLSAFRAWASFWEHSQSSSPAGGYAAYSDVSRRQIWKEYYVTLTTILQQGLPFPITSMATAYSDSSTRGQQQAELQRVESKYEDLLLREVQFPRADQTSNEVEEWTNLVVQNWRVLCGNGWLEGDQDQSGKEAVSRRVLDILYRAATKTFHSTAILRHLFTVHLAVGEFDIAFNAFDTYLEIVKKGKARVEKACEVEKSLDSDEAVLKTVSECIRALCRYGSREAAEKAKDLAQYFEDWLSKHHPYTMVGNDVSCSGSGGPIVNGLTASPISPEVLAIAWRSIGIAKAQWARVTYDAGSRSDIQIRAIKSLRKALSPEYNSMDDVETLFALALVLSERRELNAAIEVVKKALLPPTTPPTSTTGNLGPSGVRFAREKSLIPLWHLLALLLSARQEFTTAARACEGAFEQFQDPKNLFGDVQLTGTYRSEHLNLKDIREKSSSQSRGVVDDMDDFQKETVLEVKMTQLTLIEILEGPEVAVNASDELLSLYTRLFGEPQQPVIPPPKMAQTLPPNSSAGTLRSIKGSLFGRSRPSIRKSSVTRGRTSPISEKSTLPARPQTSQTSQTHASTVRRGPTIHVTNENGGTTSQSHHEKLHKRRSASLSRQKSHSSVRYRSTSEGPARIENKTPSAADATESDRVQQQEDKSMPLGEQENAEQTLDVTNSGQIGRAISPGHSSVALPIVHDGPQRSSSKRLPPTTQNMPQEEEPLKLNTTAQQDTRLPYKTSRSSSTNSYTRFSKDQERRRRIEILIRVWLLIAGFYRRAEMFEDAKGAIDEAYKLVDNQEMDVSKDTSGNVTIQNGGWGSIKSVEELWGDVWSEVHPKAITSLSFQLIAMQRGYLSIAKELPYTALSDFEAALTHYADHPSAIVGLSNILLDIYTETLPPAPSLPSIGPPSLLNTPSQSTVTTSTLRQDITSPYTTVSATSSTLPTLQSGPLGLANHNQATALFKPSNSEVTDSTALLDRLAARDRAYGLLSGLTKLGSGWNYSEAWFALARAQEEAGLVDKARDALWWCVELEEGRGVRSWNCVSAGGYVL